VVELRARQSRAILATLLLSLGVPMVLGGDEIGRTQQGNNNAYCQDNELSWFDWASPDAAMLEFVTQLTALRRRHHVLRRRRFVTGARKEEIVWFTPAGSIMTDSDWQAGWTRSVMAYLDGIRGADRDGRGGPILDEDLLLVVNGWWEPLTFTLPDVGTPRAWMYEIDSYAGVVAAADSAGAANREAGSKIVLEPRSLVLLRAARPAGTSPIPATP